jgi:hypothetical protein
MGDLYRVVTTDGRNRKVFEGTEKSALRYVQEHYPRIHAEPGIVYDSGPLPDVFVMAPNNTVRGYHGLDDDEPQWVTYEKDEHGWFAPPDETDTDTSPAPVKATPTKPTGK